MRQAQLSMLIRDVTVVTDMSVLQVARNKNSS
jgi:hypothetical protein